MNPSKKKLSCKRLITLLAVTLCINYPCFAQITTEDSVRYAEELISIEQKLMDAIPSGDTAIWSYYLDENFFILTEDGTRLSRSKFIASMSPMPNGYSGWIKIINPKLAFYGNTAVINYVSDEHEFVFGQQLHTTYSSMDTYIKKDNRWKMIASQVFEIPALPTAIKISAGILKKYTGTHRLSDTIACMISLQNDMLYIQKKNRPKEALFPETETVFFRQSDARDRKIFVMSPRGIMTMLERRNGQDISWKRIHK